MTVTNPLLTAGGSILFSSSGTNVLTLYGVQEEGTKKSSGLVEFPMPATDSDKKIAMDLLGASRTIHLSGIVTSQDVTSLYDYTNDLVGLKNTPTNGYSTLISGTQGNNGGRKGYAYTGWTLNAGRLSTVTISVYVTEVSVNATKGDPSSFTYTIDLMECSGTNSN